MSDDFEDFEPSTVTASTLLSSITSVNTPGTTHAPGSFSTPSPILGNSPWYAIWERHSANEFRYEFFALGLLIFAVTTHIWGVQRNRKIAAAWVTKHQDVLEQEFAMVGCDGLGRANTLEESGGAESGATAAATTVLIKENSPTEFVAYASGRQNIAFAHITIRLMKRNNPIALLGEIIAAFVFDSVPAPTDNVTITIQPFDGKESELGKEVKGAKGSSKFDNFIWAVVNKKTMKKWREERYDLSLTTTKDWEGLPRWASVMTEANEIGTVVMTKEIMSAVDELGMDGGLEYLIVTDQRTEKPIKLEETVPKKRLSLHLTLPTSFSSFLPFGSTNLGTSNTTPLLSAFIRLTDHLANVAHFRPEVIRKIKATREEQARALVKVAEEEKTEEREQRRAEEKKKERDAKLRNMSAEEQKKFLEKEKEKEKRRAEKKTGKRVIA